MMDVLLGERRAEERHGDRRQGERRVAVRERRGGLATPEAGDAWDKCAWRLQGHQRCPHLGLGLRENRALLLEPLWCFVTGPDVSLLVRGVAPRVRVPWDGVFPPCPLAQPHLPPSTGGQPPVPERFTRGEQRQALSACEAVGRQVCQDPRGPEGTRLGLTSLGLGCRGAAWCAAQLTLLCQRAVRSPPLVQCVCPPLACEDR